MNKLLKGLHLRLPTGGLVKPFSFTDDAKSELGKWFDASAVARLEDFVEVALDLETDSQEQPTIGESRKVMLRISELADALSTALNGAPEMVRAELTVIGLKSFGDWQKAERLSSEILVLALASRERAEKLPAQTRPSSYRYLVSGIAAEAETAGIALSDSEHSKFAAICRCVFESVGIYQDPRGSIRSFLSSRA